MNKVRKFGVFVLLAMIFSFANVSPAGAATSRRVLDLTFCLLKAYFSPQYKLPVAQ